MQNDTPVASLYIHIPFCRSRCIYCDFCSQTDFSLKNKYILALQNEILLRKSELKGELPATLYFGGGTPSLLEANDWETVFDTLRNNFDFSVLKEITIEVNPEDVTTENARLWHSFGINRASMGIQSFNDRFLKLLKRRHSGQQAKNAINILLHTGFYNTGIDLIYSLPGQLLADWKSDLDTALAFNLPHLSAYCLTYEKGTVLYNMLETGKVESVDEQTQIDMFQMLMDETPKTGYEHYEISNFAKPGFHSLHNSSYWNNTPYLGLGAGAHSYDLITRKENTADIERYINLLCENKSAFSVERLTSDTRYNEFIMIRLRTRQGIDLQVLILQYGQQYYDYCMHNAAKYIETGLLTIDNNCLILTRQGIFVADSIIAELMIAQ